ncbi:MAG: AI-2E family transporter [Betaproteobacteria bacterium]|nr:AI-2E family transporter [Betaproteobacteria bacterium]
MNVGVSVIAIVAAVAALYLARAFVIPLLLGIFASYTLSPLVDWLKAWRVPRPLAAALVLSVLAGGVSWLGVSLSDGAAEMTENLPRAAQKLRQKLNAAGSGGPTALQNMQEAAGELEGAASKAGVKRGTSVASDRAPEVSSWLREYALAQTGLLFAVISQAPVVLLLTYFLLASGEHFRRKLVQAVGRSLSRKKDTVRILDEIDAQVKRYLLSMLLSNVLVGVGTWLAFMALGMDEAGVWGVAAGVLHFIPYLGPASIAIASGVVGLLQFDSLVYALTIAGVSLLIAGTVGVALTTWLQSRFARLNAAVLFIALLFFGWLWGAWGLLLGAPLIAIVKAICDRVESLKPAGELLGR